MQFSEFKEKIMRNKNAKFNPEKLPVINQLLPKLPAIDQVELISWLLEKQFLPVLHEKKLEFVALKKALNEEDFKNNDELVSYLIDLTSQPKISSEFVEKIFRSTWSKAVSFHIKDPLFQWVFAFYNFKKDYAGRFIEALMNETPFSLWRQILYADPNGLITVSQIEKFKPLFIEVLKGWPTSGRSGYFLLNQLKQLNSLKFLLNDLEVQQVFQTVENQCDFGSIDQINKLLNQNKS